MRWYGGESLCSISGPVPQSDRFPTTTCGRRKGATKKTKKKRWPSTLAVSSSVQQTCLTSHATTSGRPTQYPRARTCLSLGLNLYPSLPPSLPPPPSLSLALSLSLSLFSLSLSLSLSLSDSLSSRSLSLSLSPSLSLSLSLFVSLSLALSPALSLSLSFSGFRLFATPKQCSSDLLFLSLELKASALLGGPRLACEVNEVSAGCACAPSRLLLREMFLGNSGLRIDLSELLI